MVEEPTNTRVITRKILEEEYELLGYSVLEVTAPSGEVRFGTFVLDMYAGPIYVEELDALKRTDMTIKVTIGRPGDEIEAEKFTKTK